MAEREADTVVILSSELISKITEEYFNKTMFKQRVEIVDLKPTETGYMFSVVFVSKNKLEPVEQVSVGIQPLPVGYKDDKVIRASNGQFTKIRERVNG